MTLRDLTDACARRYDEFVDALGEMVNVDCGSFTPTGVNLIADLCQARFEKGGWEIERRSHAPAAGERQLGDLVIGHLAGAPGGPRVLLIGHTDTVFSEGTAAERPFRVEGDRAFGPGVSDMKGGLLIGFLAMEALVETGAAGFGKVTYVCNPDEEIGSPFSGPVIKGLAKQADVAFVLESARANGDIVAARKGVSDFRIDVVGRAAHAGVEPEKGRSAILEAAYKVVALHELNGRWPGVTVNVGVVAGGSRTNVVAERCRIEVDVRSPREETFRQAEDAVRHIAETHTDPDVHAEVRHGSWHRPFEKKDGSARLAETAVLLARELGFEVRDAATGGASDANTTSAAGVPTLDGLGPIGGDDHSPGEWIDLRSVTPRMALLGALVSRAGSVAS